MSDELTDIRRLIDKHKSATNSMMFAAPEVIMDYAKTARQYADQIVERVPSLLAEIERLTAARNEAKGNADYWHAKFLDPEGTAR